LCAAQGIELRRPLRSSATLEKAFDSVRAVAPFFASDRALSGEIARVAKLIEDGRAGS
jgi:histidine ammonia-lyase